MFDRFLKLVTDNPLELTTAFTLGILTHYGVGKHTVRSKMAFKEKMKELNDMKKQLGITDKTTKKKESKNA